MAYNRYLRTGVVPGGNLRAKNGQFKSAMWSAPVFNLPGFTSSNGETDPRTHADVHVPVTAYRHGGIVKAQGGTTAPGGIDWDAIAKQNGFADMNAVKEWQTKNGLVADGKFGPASQAKLKELKDKDPNYSVGGTQPVETQPLQGNPDAVQQGDQTVAQTQDAPQDANSQSASDAAAPSAETQYEKEFSFGPQTG